MHHQFRFVQSASARFCHKCNLAAIGELTDEAKLSRSTIELNNTVMLRPFHTVRGCTLSASDGEIGKVHEFYFDDEHWTVRYFVVNTGSWLTGRTVLIAPRALGEVDAQGGAIAVNLTKEQVRHSPAIDSDKPVSRQHEEELHRYYGWDPYWVVPGAVPGLWAPVPPSLSAMPSAAAAAPELCENLQPDVAPEQPKGDPHLRSSAELMSGYKIHAQDGEIGRVEDFILDDESWRVSYLVVHTGVWFLGKDALLAPEWIEGISYERAEVFVNLPRSAIKDAPGYDSAAPLGARSSNGCTITTDVKGIGIQWKRRASRSRVAAFPARAAARAVVGSTMRDPRDWMSS